MQLLTALTQKGYQLGYQGVSEGSTVAKSSSLAGLTSSILRQDLQTARSQGASERRGILWRWRGPSGLRWVWRNARASSAKTRGFHTQLDEGPETP